MRVEVVGGSAALMTIGRRRLGDEAATPVSDDETRFAVLFDEHFGALWNYAYRLSGSRATAEDLTANTFLTAWSKRDSVDLFGRHPLPWLFTVASNLYRSELRSSTRYRRALARLPMTTTAPDHSDDVVSAVDTSAHRARVAHAVQSLPRSEREVVELCLLGEVGTAEAAEVLGIAEVSVRSRISRARARLRRMFEEGQR